LSTRPRIHITRRCTANEGKTTIRVRCRENVRATGTRCRMPTQTSRHAQQPRAMRSTCDSRRPATRTRTDAGGEHGRASAIEVNKKFALQSRGTICAGGARARREQPRNNDSVGREGSANSRTRIGENWPSGPLSTTAYRSRPTPPPSPLLNNRIHGATRPAPSPKATTAAADDRVDASSRRNFSRPAEEMQDF